MSYKPVQNESAHLTDKPGRSAFKPAKKPHKRKSTETQRMKTPMKMKKPGKKTDS